MHNLLHSGDSDGLVLGPRRRFADVDPGAVLYLGPAPGFGASPASRKRWSQVRKLTVQMCSGSALLQATGVRGPSRLPNERPVFVEMESFLGNGH
jgi:hypothetical protein